MAPVASSGREASAIWDAIYSPKAMKRRAAQRRYNDLLDQKKVYENLIAIIDRELQELRRDLATILAS